MNKILSIFLLILVSDSMSAQEQNGKVYFIRSEGSSAPAAAFNLFNDQKYIGKLNNKSYSIHEVTPGKHTFSTRFSGKKPSDKDEKIEMEIESGKSYYIQVKFQHELFKNKLHFKQAKEDDVKNKLPGLKQVKN